MARIFLGLCALVALAACSISKSTGNYGMFFEGSVLNVVTTERLAGYTLTIRQNGNTYTAEVDEDGHYRVGPLRPDADFVVTISAEGFRAFVSSNDENLINLPNNCQNTESSSCLTTEVYDAWLVPENAVAGAQTFEFFVAGRTIRPTGELRLIPQGRTNLENDLSLTGAVANRRWLNDRDIQSGTVTASVADGVATVEAGQLQYGVTYRINVFSFSNDGSNGFFTGGTTFTAGTSADIVNIALSTPDTSADLRIVSISNTAGGSIVESGQLEIIFNQNVEVDNTLDFQLVRDQINSGLSIGLYTFDGDTDDDDVDDVFGTSDYDNDGNVIVLEPVGTDRLVNIDGIGINDAAPANTLRLTWDRTASLDEDDVDDIIETVTYGNLDAIRVRRAGSQDGFTDIDNITELDGSLGSSETVRIAPEPVDPY